MSMSKTVIDVRGLACPEPLIAFANAAKNTETTEIDISFDCAAARDNISRAAPAAGWKVDSIEDKKEYTIMLLSRKE